MAKYLLWGYVVFFVVICLVDSVIDQTSSFRDLTWNVTIFWIIVSVLAITEAIESIKK